MSDGWAFVANQNSKIQSLLISDSETGNASKAPKLMTFDDYYNWKDRFETYLNGVDTNLWLLIEEGYRRPMYEGTGTMIEVSKMTEIQRKQFDYEKRAFAAVTQAIPNDIHHQFKTFRTSKELWDALKDRIVGNDYKKSIKGSAIKKEFENFMHMPGETLSELITRFYHLLSEMHEYGNTTTIVEKINCLYDALPDKSRSVAATWKKNDTFEMGLNAFIQKLEAEEVDEKRRSKRIAQPQDPSLYHSSTPATPGIQSAKLQTAFISNQKPIVEESQSSGSSFGSGFMSSGTSSGNQSHNKGAKAQESNTMHLPTKNLSNVTIEVAKEHVSLIAALVTSYDELIAGKIGNFNLTYEDYEQVDKDELELMDIKWAFASTIRRAKEYTRRTGKEITGTKDMKYGFDMSKVRCYNCQTLGHFARQCDKPKQFNSRNPFTASEAPKSNVNNEKNVVVTESSNKAPTSSSSALVSQMDEGFDWANKICEMNSSACFACADSNEEAKIDEIQTGSESDDSSETSEDASVENEVFESQKDDSHVQSEYAFMADTKNEKVEISCSKCDELLVDLERLRVHNQNLVNDLSLCVEANTVLKNNERDYKLKVKTLNDDNSELQQTVLHKQHAVNAYLDQIAKIKLELANVTIEYENVKTKLESYTNSAYVLDHILQSQKGNNNKEGLGFNACPPPINNHFSKLPEENEITEFKVTTPLIIDPKDFDFENDDLLGSTTSEETVSRKSSEFDAPLMEEWDSSDDESEVVKAKIVKSAFKSKNAVRSEKKDKHVKHSQYNSNVKSEKLTDVKLKLMTNSGLKPIIFVNPTGPDNAKNIHKGSNVEFFKKKDRDSIVFNNQNHEKRKSIINQSKNFTKQQSSLSPPRVTKPIVTSPKGYQNYESRPRSPGSFFRQFNQSNHSPPRSPRFERRKCYECRGFGHFVANCPNLLNSKKKVEKGFDEPVVSNKSVKFVQSPPKVFPSVQISTPKVSIKKALQQNVYYKTKLNDDQIWKTKKEISVVSTSGTSIQDNSVCDKSTSLGKFVKYVIVDKNGQPKTRKAWVSNA